MFEHSERETSLWAENHTLGSHESREKRGCGMVVHFSPLDSCLALWPPQETVANQVHREHPDPKRTRQGKGLLALN